MSCPPGLSCGNPFCTASSSLPCSPGFICPAQSSISPCPSGHYCPAYSMASGRDCSEGSWCPQYSKAELPCDIGAYCPANSERQLSWLGLVIVVSVLVAAGVLYWIFIRKRNQQREQRLRTKRKSAGNSVVSLPTCSSYSPSSVVTRVPMDIEFENLRCEIKQGGIFTRNKKTKVIMDGVDGTIRSGYFTAIMGPSGAGKTTLMSILAGKVKRSAGKIRLNGREYEDLSAVKSLFGFVPQDDIMNIELTPKEVLLLNADLRLPSSLTVKERHAIVNETIEKVMLDEVRHVQIGDEAEGKRGISGGQRKRVNISEELVSVPSCLFCDEPTTGLDASSAETVCEHLKSVARSGVTVVAVIHQPRNEIFESIDQLILLAPGGRMAYSGPPLEIKAYLASLGYICPKGTNVPDYMMDVVAGKATNTDGKVLNLADAWLQHMANRKNAVHVSGVPEAAPMSTAPIVLRSKPSFLRQFVTLIARSCIITYRNWISIAVQCFMHSLAGLVVGLAFTTGKVYIPPVPFSYVALGLCPSVVSKPFCQFPILDITGALNDYVIMALGLTAVATSVRTFGRERLIAWREASVGVLWPAYALAKWTLDIPLIALYSLCFNATLQMVSSLQGEFFQYWLVFIMTEFVVFGFGYDLSAFMRVKNATLFGVIACLSWIITDGGPFTVSEMGLLGTVSYPRWTSEAIFLTEIGYDNMDAADQQLLKTYLDKYRYGWEIGNYGVDIGMLFLLGLVFRMLHLVLLWACNRDKRK